MSVKTDKRAAHDWLTPEFLTKALRESWKLPELTVTSLDVKPAIPVGENYASLMFRTIANLKKTASSKEETVSFVCKTPTRAETLNKSLNGWDYSIFEKEGDILQNIMPKINSFLIDSEVTEEPLSAECLHYCKEPGECLVLEDLKESGFVSPDRHGGLEWETTKLVLRGLARLHAGSIAAIKQEPKLCEKYSQHMWTQKQNGLLEKMVESSIASTITEVSKSTDFPPEYLEKLIAEKPQFYRKTVESLKSLTEEDPLVFLHGDCWSSNYMLKMGNNGEYDGLRFVDFQCSSLSSRASDLNYFLMTSPKPEIRFEIIEDSLAIYNDAFVRAINKLGLPLEDAYSLKHLKDEFKRFSYFGFAAFLTIYPITIAEVKDVISVDEFFDEEGKGGMYRSATFQRVLKDAMAYFIENGVF